MTQQAQFFVSTAGIDPEMSYAADHEDAGVSLDDLKDFCAEVERLIGKPPIIYSGHLIKDQIGSGRDAELARYPLWLNHWNSNPTWPTATWPTYWLWQYSDGQSGPLPHGCPGMRGDVDTNSYDGVDDQLIAEWTGTAVPTPGVARKLRRSRKAGRKVVAGKKARRRRGS
jgi:lysozyme